MKSTIKPGPLRLTLLAFLVIFILNILCPRVIPISYVATVGYAGLLLVWGISVSFRIMVRNLRFYLLTGAFLTTSLFAMRWFRWNSDSALASRYLWYLMYVPFLFVPLLSFFAALSTVHRDKERPVGRFIVLLPIGVILLLLVLTNDLTGIIFTVRQVGDKISYDYKPMYYILVAWEMIFTIATFGVLLHYCRLSQCRRRWFVPVFFFIIGFVALVAYMINGGSFYIAGINLYNVQEAWGFLFVVLWESFIHIGFIPSNSGYRELFEASHVAAAILDKEGRVLHSSLTYQKEQAETGCENASLVRLSHPISGGTVTWIEDHLNIMALNDEIARIADETVAENELIEQENAIAAEKTAYEERNRLYDAIADSLKPEISKLRKLLSADNHHCSERDTLIAATVLGAYIKRRANLTILADKESRIMSTELVLSIRETMEYLELSGTACEVREEKPSLVKPEYVFRSYEFFEAVLEASDEPMSACSVTVSGNPFSITIMTDYRPYVSVSEEVDRRMEEAGLNFTLRVVDDTAILTYRE